MIKMIDIMTTTNAHRPALYNKAGKKVEVVDLRNEDSDDQNSSIFHQNLLKELKSLN